MSLFVTFEGTEGSGKTTQIRLLRDALVAERHAVVVTREPGGTPLGEALRELLLESPTLIGAESEAYLMTGARAQHVRDVIRPALDAGKVVLCDRFIDSTFAYQGGGRGLASDELERLQHLAIGETRPDLTILLDVPISVGLRRRAGETVVNRLDLEDFAFHERVGAWYRAAAAREPRRWVVVDAMEAPAIVHTAVYRAVIDRLALVSMPVPLRGSVVE